MSERDAFSSSDVPRPDARQTQFLTVITRDEATARFQRHLALQPLGRETVPLARALHRVLADDIVAAVEGPAPTLVDEHDHCEGHCVLQEVWVELDDETRTVLERYTLADLVDRTVVGHAR